MIGGSKMRSRTLSISLAALMGVITAAGAYITIPLPFSPVPITGQTFFVLLAGLLLGTRLGALAMVVYVVIGAVGFPVYAGGTGGVGHLIGPTGGYIFGFIAAGAVTGLIARLAVGKGRKLRLALFIGAVVAGEVAIYVFGIPWLAAIADLSLVKALSLGLVPFIPGDSIKAVAAVLVSELLWARAPFVPIKELKR